MVFTGSWNGHYFIIMKIINLFFLSIVLLATGVLASCSGGGNSPVDQYVELLDAATAKIEKINANEGVTDIQDILSMPKAQDLEKEYADYELTDKDKEKLKMSLDRLIHAAYDKTMQYAGFPEEIIQMKKKQVELMVDAANQQIDAATTLGEIGHPR